MLDSASHITGLILAGGLARRMGGADKGLQAFAGRPLLSHVIDRFAPQVGSLLLNVNHNAAAYARFGCPIVPDALEGYAGPLAGLAAALARCQTPLLACVPCDAPFLPHDLVVRLEEALAAGRGRMAVARAGGRVQRAFMLCRREVLPDLDAFLAGGGREVGQWQAQARNACVEAGFEDADAFANINTLEELKRFEDDYQEPP